MEQRVSLFTLGCRDVDRARAFYEAMGWKAGMVVPDDVCFFQANGAIFALWQREKMVADAGIPDGQGFAGVTLAYNTRDEAEVDAVIAQASAAGATILRQPQRAFWGGWTACFADPEGFVWEVAHNPDFSLDAEGNISLPGA